MRATTSDGANTAVYASIDAANPQRLVLVMINRTAAAVTTGARIWETTAYTSARVYQLAGAVSTPQDKGTVAISGNTLNLTLPGYSVTTVLLQP